MVHNKFGKAMERLVTFLQDKERRGKKKVVKAKKPPKPMSEHPCNPHYQLMLMIDVVKLRKRSPTTPVLLITSVVNASNMSSNTYQIGTAYRLRAPNSSKNT